MTLAELKKGLLSLMQTVFPSDQYKYYSMDVVEGFERPCFFTNLKPVNTDPNNFNSRNNQIAFYINYFQLEIDEVDLLDKIDQLRNLFGLAVIIGDRAVKVSDFEWDYIGTDRNVVEISVSFQWSDKIERIVSDPDVGSVETNINLNGGN